MKPKISIGSLEDYNMGLETGRNKALDEVEKKLPKWMNTWEKRDDINLSQCEFLLRRINQLRGKSE